jgi:hypothetical protein
MNSRPLLATLIGSLVCSASLHAADAATGKNEAPVEPYHLKNRSNFKCASEETRAPFWPIGWVHRKGTVASAVETPAAPKELLDPSSFKVTSILLGSGATPSLAVINGRAYSEGEFLRVPRRAAPVATATGEKTASTAPAARTRVHRITDGSVMLQRETQVITVALQRPELVQRKIEDTLIDEDR